MRISIPGTDKGRGGYLYMDALVGLIILSLAIGGLAGVFITAAQRVGAVQERVEHILQESLGESL